MPTPNLSATKASRGMHRMVNYVDQKGQTQLAEVVGGGTIFLVLKLRHKKAAPEFGCAKRTALNQTNVWY